MSNDNLYNKYVRDEASKKFYSSKRWKRLRQAALARDRYACVICARYFKNTPAVIVHHIKEVSEHPELKYKLSNLASVCRSCHNKIHGSGHGERQTSKKKHNYTRK